MIKIKRKSRLSQMDELNDGFSEGMDFGFLVSHRPYSGKPGFGGNLVYRKKRASKEKKLIDIGLRRCFGGYWKIFNGR